MKRLVFAAGILAFLLMGQAGFAKTLEEVLKEKGVITEADLKEVTTAKARGVPARQGVHVHLARRAVPAFPRRQRTVPIPVRGQGRRERPGAEHQSWRVRRFKVYMGGYAFTKNLTYRVQLDVAKSDGDPGRRVDQLPLRRRGAAPGGPVQDAFRPGRAHLRRGVAVRRPRERRGRLQAQLRHRRDGAWGRRPVGSSPTTRGSSTAPARTGRARPTAGPGRRGSYSAPSGRCRTASRTWGTPRTPSSPLGAELLREHAEAERELQFLDTTTSTPPYAGTSGWLGKAATNTAIFDNTERVDVGTYGFDAAFKWRGFSAQGEYFGGKADGQNSGRSVQSRGYYGQAGYFLLPKQP